MTITQHTLWPHLKLVAALFMAFQGFQAARWLIPHETQRQQTCRSLQAEHAAHLPPVVVAGCARYLRQATR